MSAFTGLAVWFDGELWLGGVAGVGDFDIDKAKKGKVGGAGSVCQTEIIFHMGWSG